MGDWGLGKTNKKQTKNKQTKKKNKQQQHKDEREIEIRWENCYFYKQPNSWTNWCLATKAENKAMGAVRTAKGHFHFSKCPQLPVSEQQKGAGSWSIS